MAGPFTLGIAKGFLAPVAHLGRRSNRQAAHSNPKAWLPTWKWVPPPGVGDAPQHVFATFSLIPLDIRGAGDNPAVYLRSFFAPVVQNFAMRWQGIPVEGGNFLMTGLYSPEPMGSPANDVFSGMGG